MLSELTAWSEHCNNQGNQFLQLNKQSFFKSIEKKLSSALVGAFLSLFLALKCDVWQWDIVPILYEFATTKSPFFKLFSRLYCLECRAFEKKIIKNKGKSFDQFS